ncbi:dTDP-4-dehydrorhamnose 3,5-epimerase family protein [Nocardiopsis changdeensis]|uniref:dTDP-4-dehydrorhamnose 3,5-epimerase family protein n=1 Tax=Nocardiopsis changdeensis TaxID=2831969 RepID=A0ABX8BSC4_9ACTN|nr:MULTISPECIES: dTDP-4-dehydrorhamnose 3,5-epimerase family protein [Nocardiopsis]QUX25172.1 dTDP-4-dehydrorhamnose 3,5-epimerase family protein [Nocardiopsis changdeensis]QYX35559.1 dTDP-4-dehydrorhamnose 3,5-epimerase family protein [Nocardiopsis sp. MT53]
MRARQLSIPGALVFTAPVYSDPRGTFTSPFLASAFAEAAGHPLFAPAQISHSRSRRGVVRGVHYTATPPGMAKLVHCPQGRALDFIVDLRTGSPAFGRWESVELDPASGRSAYLPVGVGHLFVALEDDTVMSYFLSREYVAENERAVAPFDPDLGLEIPPGHTQISERDRVAPSLGEAARLGALPDYRECLVLEQSLHAGEGGRVR